MTKTKKAVKEQTIEQRLRYTADALGKSIEATEYKRIVIGLIFLKYISDPDDHFNYRAEGVFTLPLRKLGIIFKIAQNFRPFSKDIDDAMDAIEKHNTNLKGLGGIKYMVSKL